MDAIRQRQCFALSNILKNGNDTEALKAFAQTVITNAGQFGTILTVDLWKGALWWHASVSALTDQFRPLSWNKLHPLDREAVRQLAWDLLADVGHRDFEIEDVQENSYQIIRRLTAEEERVALRQSS